MFKAACIIPTKDRAFDLVRLLHSVKDQDIIPQEIIIVDASETSSLPAQIDQGTFSPLNIKYVKAQRACLAAQRNQGVALLSPDIRLVCFLDDDIVFCEGAIRAMFEFWEKIPDDVAGAMFNIINEKKPTAGVFFKKIFCTGSFKRGIVLPSGYNTLMCPAKETMDVQWLVGAGMVFRRDVFKDFSFDPWFEGTGLCEDLDFSYRVGKKYRLVVVADARIEHLTGTIKRRRNVWFGHSQIINRYYFVQKNEELSKALCLWAGLGQLLENLTMGVLLLNGYYFLRAWGNVTGFFALGNMKIIKDNI